MWQLHKKESAEDRLRTDEEAWERLIIALYEISAYDIRHKSPKSRDYIESVNFLKGTKIGCEVLRRLKEEGCYNEKE